MDTRGGTYQPDDIDMVCKLAEQLAANREGRRLRFRVCRIFEIEEKFCVIPEVWRKRLNRAINSIDGEGGWNGMVNSLLELYLGPLGCDWKSLDAIVKAVNMASKEAVPKC